jgi:hypothetical protein
MGGDFGTWDGNQEIYAPFSGVFMVNRRAAEYGKGGPARMKGRLARTLVAATLGLTLAASAGAAFADTQPSNGITSTGRNDQGFGGGPHCHVMSVDNNGRFDTVVVYPSHTGHSHAGNDVFLADPDCDGDAGA